MTEILVGEADPAFIIDAVLVFGRPRRRIPLLPEEPDEDFALAARPELEENVAFDPGDDGRHVLEPGLVLGQKRLLGLDLSRRNQDGRDRREDEGCAAAEKGEIFHVARAY